MIEHRKKGTLILLILLMLFTVACSSSGLNTREKEELVKKMRRKPYDEISFERILIESKFKLEDIYIEDFNVAINNKQYIESFNIIFTQIDTRKEFILMYRRENRLFKIIEQEKEFASSNSSNTRILEVIDNELIPLITIDQAYDATIVDLIAPIPIEVSSDTGVTYFNGLLIDKDEKEKLKGLAFFSYKKPVQEDDSLIKYIFEQE